MPTMFDVFSALGAPRSEALLIGSTVTSAIGSQMIADAKRAIRFPGIVQHAKALRVSRIHLYFVLTGVRRSPRIESYIRKHMRRAS